MLTRRVFAALAAACALWAAGCGGRPADESANTAPGAAPAPTVSGMLPDSGFRAQITLADPPARLRAGQKATVNVKVKNASDVSWPRPSGEGTKYVVAVGNNWLGADGELVTNMDGRYGVQQDLAPGEEVELPLVITAPPKPGEYTLELDMLQEQVAWFKEKGSETYKVKIKVE